MTRDKVVWRDRDGDRDRNEEYIGTNRDKASEWMNKKNRKMWGEKKQVSEEGRKEGRE